MSEKGSKKSFWTSLPGILTGLATLIGAVGSLYLAFWNGPTNDVGSLQLISDSTAREAKVYVDEVFKGEVLERGDEVRLSVPDLMLGNHYVLVKKTNFKEFTRAVNLTGPQPVEILFTLIPLTPDLVSATPTTGSVLMKGLNAAAEDAEVYLDSEFRGRIHDHEGRLQLFISSLSAGTHDVKVAKADHQEFNESVTVVPRQTAEVSVKLARLEPPSEPTPVETSSGETSTGERPGPVAVEINPGAVAAMLAVRSRLPAPKQLSPVSGSQFQHYPRKTTLRWTAVSDAKNYTVDVQYCQPKGCADTAKPWRRKSGIRDTRFSFNFVGAQPGRWRVWAVNASGKAGTPSPWWEFRYTK